MSKEKPEVGDVWVTPRAYDCIIVEINRYDTSEYITYLSERYVSNTVNKAEFLLCFGYKGKSKVSIKELFDVKD